jgi:hypothetical protein
LLDVFFITMGEEGSELNWERLSKFAPHAKRVDNVQGIFNVHKACAELSTTENFWVVDADAWIVDGFNFMFEPDKKKLHWGIPETDCVLVWQSRNPVNGLEYGYGGVKLFPRAPFMKNLKWDIDLSTTIGRSTVSMERVSCETRFNASPKSAWIGAFRECAKLASLSMIKSKIRKAQRNEKFELETLLETFKENDTWNTEKGSVAHRVQSVLIHDRYKDESTIYRYWDEIEQCSHRRLIWTTVGWEEHNGKYAISGAQAGAKFGLIYADDLTTLNLINDWQWLEKEFNNVTI